MKAGRSTLSFTLIMLACSLGSEARANVRQQAPSRAPASDAAAAPSGAPRQSAQGARQEAEDRAIDAAAIAAQETAIRKLKGQLTRSAGKTQNPNMLMRLADLLQQVAEKKFRVIMGPDVLADSAKAQSAVKNNSNLAEYRAYQKDLIATLTDIVTQFPKYEETRRAYFMRAKAYRELGESKIALKEFQDLTQRFPGSKESMLSHVYSAEISVEVGEYRLAIEYLKKSRIGPEHPQYSFILEKIAWCYYSLNEISEGMRYIEKIMAFETKNLAKKPELAANRIETAMIMAATFYSTAMEHKQEGYALEGAMPYFKKLTQSAVLGKTYHQFALSLRVKGLENELIGWKEIVLKDAANYPETSGVLFTSYEAIIHWKKFDLLTQLPKDLGRVSPKISSDPHYKKLQKLILETSEQFIASCGKNPKPEDLLSISAPLTSLYSGFLLMTPKKDPLYAVVLQHLADHYFETHNYPAAANAYQNILETSHELSASPDMFKQAHLRLISAKYEQLSAAHLIPQDLQVVGYHKPAEGQKTAAKPASAASSENKAKLNDWVRWLDKFEPQTDTALENFQFEANRALYAQGELELALKRCSEMIKRTPKSKYAIPAASLIVDTEIASQDWEAAYETARTYLQAGWWANDPFSKRLEVVASDSYLKLVEEAYAKKDYPKALERAENFIRAYPRHKNVAIAVGAAGDSALQIGKKSEGLNYVQQIITKYPDSGYYPKALLARAQNAEDNWSLSAAGQDYMKLRELPPQRSGLSKQAKTDLERKILLLSYVGEKPGQFHQLLKGEFCKDRALQGDCEMYRTLVEIKKLGPNGRVADGKTFAAQAVRSRGVLALEYAALALASAKPLAERDRTQMLKIVEVEFPKAPTIYKLPMFQLLNSGVIRQFKLSKDKYFQGFAINNSPDLLERSIKHRLRQIKRFESALAVAMKLPLQETHVALGEEVASLYTDLSREVSRLRAPRGLSAPEKKIYKEFVAKLATPFEEKSKELLNLALQNAAESGALSSGASKTARVVEFGPRSLAEFEGAEAWSAAPADANEKDAHVQSVKSAIAAALTAGNAPRAAYLIDLAREKKEVSESSLKLAQAALLSLIGARAESVNQLAQVSEELGGDSKIRAYLSLASQYARAGSKAKATEYIQRITSSSALRDSWIYETAGYSAALKSASDFAGVDLGESVRDRLLASGEQESKP